MQRNQIMGQIGGGQRAAHLFHALTHLHQIGANGEGVAG